MFCRISFAASVLIIILFFAGCGASVGVDSGIEPTETLDLDGEFESSMSLEKGDVIGLDMRLPVKSGYRIVGAAFDPSLLRLEHYLEYDDDGEARAEYLFSLLADGASDILIKMQPMAGGDVEIYKRVSVIIGRTTACSDDSCFLNFFRISINPPAVPADEIHKEFTSTSTERGRWDDRIYSCIFRRLRAPR